MSRKGYIAQGKLTSDGQVLWDSLQEVVANDDTKPLEADATKKRMRAVKTDKNEAFEAWWKLYPAGSTFIDSTGREWFGGRMLRQLKPKCQQYFEECLREGDTVEGMMAALNYEIELRKKRTLFKKENDFNFMQLTSTYLNQRTHRSVLDMMGSEESNKTASPIQQIKEQIDNGGFL